LIRLLLAHGDYVVACLPPLEVEHDDRSAEFRELVNECKSGRKDREGWKDRIRGIRCDGRVMGQCGAVVAEAVHVFGRIDILLCCKSEGEFLLSFSPLCFGCFKTLGACGLRLDLGPP
jgi:NAD(P)-dependent dehydrogenase (short-subunit alcohol dehydrogenase family)